MFHIHRKPDKALVLCPAREEMRDSVFRAFTRTTLIKSSETSRLTPTEWRSKVSILRDPMQYLGF